MKFFSVLAILFILTGCGFTPVHQRNLEKIQSNDIALTIDYIPEREGQLLRELLMENLQYSINPVGKKKYSVQIVLKIEERLRRSNYQLDTPNWWDMFSHADLVVIDMQVRRAKSLTLLEKQLGIRDDFEGYKVALKKTFFEQISVVTSTEPSAFELAKHQAKEQLVDLLAKSITRELQWFISEEMQKEQN